MKGYSLDFSSPLTQPTFYFLRAKAIPLRACNLLPALNSFFPLVICVAVLHILTDFILSHLFLTFSLSCLQTYLFQSQNRISAFSLVKITCKPLMGFCFISLLWLLRGFFKQYFIAILLCVLFIVHNEIWHIYPFCLLF